MLAIKNNIMAENAARHLGRSYDALSKSVERLSSGLRINSAKDDAAGLAVRELIRADVAQLQQGARNARDAVSMLQAAEGAMDVIDELLVRMKTLAEQAATASYSTEQRTIMDNEFQQLALEITRVATSTMFNGLSLLNSTDTFAFHVASADTIDIDAEEVTAAGLSLDESSIDDVTNATAALGALTTAVNTKDLYRAKLGYMMNRLESAVSVLEIQSENLLAAESRISDVDVATEMAALTRNQVLSQAGISMLAQANTLPQMALQLLRG